MQPTAETLAGIELFRDLGVDERATIAQKCKLQQFSRMPAYRSLAGKDWCPLSARWWRSISGRP